MHKHKQTTHTKIKSHSNNDIEDPTFMRGNVGSYHYLALLEMKINSPNTIRNERSTL